MQKGGTTRGEFRLLERDLERLSLEGYLFLFV